MTEKRDVVQITFDIDLPHRDHSVVVYPGSSRRIGPGRDDVEGDPPVTAGEVLADELRECFTEALRAHSGMDDAAIVDARLRVERTYVDYQLGLGDDVYDRQRVRVAGKITAVGVNRDGEHVIQLDHGTTWHRRDLFEVQPF